MPQRVFQGQLWATAAFAACLLGAVHSASAGVIFNFSDGVSLAGGSRWDAALRNIGGVGERSLVGGLRFSMQGGSYQAYRDLFAWQGGVAPSVADFTNAVNQAFNAWSSVDPVSGLGTALLFVPDLNTAVVGANTGDGGVDIAGAEIDLFGANDAFFWNPGNTGLQAETSFGGAAAPVTLTSGTVGYVAPAIAGADIIMNSNAGALWTLDVFRRVLTHEIGHAIGLGDAEGDISPTRFIDDNFNGTTSANALATLTNSWALLVNPLNPSASAGLQRFTVPFADPGTTTPGVNILMESRGVGIAPGNPVTNLVPLTNDDYGTRQFLYPAFAAVGAVPEPASIFSLGAGLLALCACCRRKRQPAA